MPTIIIEPRFCGPPDSGNGGYCCGRIANYIDGPAQVRLVAPPPLSVPLTIDVADGVVFMRDGETVIGSGQACDLELDPPPAPDLATSRVASQRYSGFEQHLFPSCFVCGPARAAGDGLRLFAGPLDDASMVATPWQPDASLCDEDGGVRNEYVWAALDCPSYFGLQVAGLSALLGTMEAEICSPPRAGGEYVVTGWRIAHEGRKYHAGSALYDAEGTLLAKAKALWIELRTS